MNVILKYSASPLIRPIEIGSPVYWTEWSDKQRVESDTDILIKGNRCKEKTDRLRQHKIEGDFKFQTCESIKFTSPILAALLFMSLCGSLNRTVSRFRRNGLPSETKIEA